MKAGDCNSPAVRHQARQGHVKDSSNAEVLLDACHCVREPTFETGKGRFFPPSVIFGEDRAQLPRELCAGLRIMHQVIEKKCQCGRGGVRSCDTGHILSLVTAACSIGGKLTGMQKLPSIFRRWLRRLRFQDLLLPICWPASFRGHPSCAFQLRL